MTGVLDMDPIGIRYRFLNTDSAYSIVALSAQMLEYCTNEEMCLIAVFLVLLTPFRCNEVI